MAVVCVCKCKLAIVSMLVFSRDAATASLLRNVLSFAITFTRGFWIGLYTRYFPFRTSLRSEGHRLHAMAGLVWLRAYGFLVLTMLLFACLLACADPSNRSFALLFRISNQGKQLTREARKVTLLSGHAAAETHHRLARAVVALRAFSRRRRGRPNTGDRLKNVSTPSFSQPQPRNTTTAKAFAKGEAPQRKRPVSVPSEGPMLSSSSPLSHSMSTDDGSLEDAANSGGDHIRLQSTGGSAFEAAAAAALAAEKAVKDAAAAASAAASAASAARGAAVWAAAEAAHAEEGSIAEALREVRSALEAGQRDATGAGAEVEQVAAGVGLAPALLGVLRALGIEGGGLGEGTAASWTENHAADVSRGENLLVFCMDVLLYVRAFVGAFGDFDAQVAYRGFDLIRSMRCNSELGNLCSRENAPVLE